MVPEFELLFDCNNKLPELKKEDTNWVPIDWADYMDPNAMTMFQGDAICNIEEEEYWEACQHALKSPYEARTSDEDEEGEKPLVMMIMVATARAIVVVIVAVVTMAIVRMIATMIVKAIIVKTMIANIVAMIGVNRLVIEGRKM